MRTKQILRKLLESKSDGVLVFKNLRTGEIKRFTQEEWDRAEWEAMSPSERRDAEEFGYMVDYPGVGDIIELDGETYKCIRADIK